LERLTDILNQVLELPAKEGLGAVVRNQVARATAERSQSDAEE
jgi:hypothetical protein